jgi:nitroreductase
MFFNQGAKGYSFITNFARNTNGMINTLLNHVSIRKYQDKPVPSELLQSVLEAGIRASTTGNMQVYSIIATTDVSIKEDLSPCHFNQPMVKQAPVVLTFCADFNRFNNWCKLRGAKPGYDNFLSFMTAAIDALLVAQNVCIAAEDNGLGICYLGTTTYMAGKIIEVLDLPKGVVPVTTLTLGYPDENPPLTDRLPLEAVVHMEKYQDYSAADIDKYYQKKELMTSYQEFVKENNAESLAHVFTNIRYKQEDNLMFSKTLLEVLRTQGYMNHQ